MTDGEAIFEYLKAVIKWNHYMGEDQYVSHEKGVAVMWVKVKTAQGEYTERPIVLSEWNKAQAILGMGIV